MRKLNLIVIFALFFATIHFLECPVMMVGVEMNNKTVHLTF